MIVCFHAVFLVKTAHRVCSLYAVVNQKLLCRILANKGFLSIDTAINGQIAVDMVNAHMPPKAEGADEKAKTLSEQEAKEAKDKADAAAAATGASVSFYGVIFMDIGAFCCFCCFALQSFALVADCCLLVA